MGSRAAGVRDWEHVGVRFAWQALNPAGAGFGFLLVLVAVGLFWGAEYLERRITGTGEYWRRPFLGAFSAALGILALGLMAIQGGASEERAAGVPARTATMLAEIESAKDHMEPEELAERRMQ